MNFGWNSWLQCSPSPQPSPPGRILSRTVTNQTAGLAMNLSELPETARRCSLSLRERVRVRACVITFLSLALVFGTLRSFAATEVEARFDAANKLYAQNKFADAAAAYEKIIAEGSVSPAMYFNQGNAYFKAGQMGRAIAAYRQAEELSPRDPDVRANVQFARNRVQGPRVSMSLWRQKLGTLSAKEWAACSTAAVWITFGLLMVRLLKPALSQTLRPGTLAAIVGSVTIIACAKLATSQSASDRLAIVITNDATIRNSPFEESPSTFTAHDGAELRVIDHKDDWLQVTDGNRNTGWVKRSAVTVAEG